MGLEEAWGREMEAGRKGPDPRPECVFSVCVRLLLITFWH